MRKTDVVKSLRTRQFATSLAIAALVCAVTLGLVYQVDANSRDAARVIEAHGQRLLSQRIALLAGRLATDLPGAEADEMRQALGDASLTMRRSLAELDRTAAPAAHAVYRNAPHSLYARTTSFLDGADAFVERSRSEPWADLTGPARSLAEEADQILPTQHVAVQVDEAATQAEVRLTEALVLGGGTLLLGAILGVFGLAFRRYARLLTRDEQLLANVEAGAAQDADREAFGVALDRAMEMVEDEPGLMNTIVRAFGATQPAQPLELLLTDGDQDRLAQMAAHPHCGAPGCTVASPRACPAVRRGRTSHFASSDALDACPHLVKDREELEPKGAVCVPVSLMGEALGVLHAELGPDEPEAEAEAFVRRLEQIANATATRLSNIRTSRRAQAPTAPAPRPSLFDRQVLPSDPALVMAAAENSEACQAEPPAPFGAEWESSTAPNGASLPS